MKRALGIVIAVVLLVAVAAAVWWTRRAPSLVLDAAREVVRERLGAELDAGDVAVSLRSITMHDVRIVRDGRAEPIEIADVRIVPSLVDALFGRPRFARVEARGVRLGAGLLERSDASAAGAATPVSVAQDGLAGPPGGETGERVQRGFDALGRLTRLLARNGFVELEDLRLETGVANEPLVVERVVVERVPRGLRTSGRMVERGGTLGWELDYDPARRHAHGELRIERFPLTGAAALLPRLPWHREGDARIDGELTIGQRAAGEPVVVEGRVALRELWLAAEGLAESPVGPIEALLEGRAGWDLEENLFQIDSGRVRLNGGDVELAGRLRPSFDRYLLDLDLRLPDSPCTRVLAAIPDALLGRFAAFDWTGSLSGSGTIHVDAADLDATAFDVDLDNRCQFVAIPPEAALERFRAPFEHAAPAGDGGSVTILTGPGTPDWTPIEEVSPFLVHAVLAHEDAGFFDHDGFAEYAIEEALEKNLERRRFAFGASTISMQLAKNLFLTRDKTLARKIREVLLTWWLEERMTKAEILELYVNVIEYGPNVYGIRPAAGRYFASPPSALTLAQSVYLAVSLPSPADQHDANFARGALAESTRREMDFLVRHMERKGRVSRAASEVALAEIESFGFEPRAATWQPGATTELPVPFDHGAFRARVSREPVDPSAAGAGRDPAPGVGLTRGR